MSVFRHGLTFVPLRLGAQVGHAGRACRSDVRTSRAERSYGRRYTVAYAMGR